MKWFFRSVETIQLNKILKAELKIGSTLYTVKLIKGDDVVEFYESKSKNRNFAPGHTVSQAMDHWKNQMFLNKVIPRLYIYERFYYLKEFEESETLKEFFEFEKVIDNQLTLDVAENSVPEEIEDLVKEIELQTAINIALDNNDKETFMLLTSNQEVTT